MNIRDLKPAGEYSGAYGVKALIFGAPGSHKTPLINTAPRPILLACEPGLMSMRGSQVPTYQAFTTEAIEGFFDWFFNSNETKNFDTLAIDSSSQITDIYLQSILTGKSKSGNKLHGKAAYGAMADECLKHFRKLYFMPLKNIYLIAKETSFDGMKRPYFPGNVLNVEVPHMYDLILHLGIHNIPGMGQLLSFQCRQTIDILARDRSGRLNDYEPPDFGKLVQKVMQI